MAPEQPECWGRNNLPLALPLLQICLFNILLQASRLHAFKFHHPISSCGKQSIHIQYIVLNLLDLLHLISRVNGIIQPYLFSQPVRMKPCCGALGVLDTKHKQLKTGSHFQQVKVVQRNKVFKQKCLPHYDNSILLSW